MHLADLADVVARSYHCCDIIGCAAQYNNASRFKPTTYYVIHIIVVARRTTGPRCASNITFCNRLVEMFKRFCYMSKLKAVGF